MGHHSHLNDDNSMLAGVAVLSALVGAVTALVLAPRSGAQTRQDIRDRIATTKEDMKSRMRDVKDAASDEAKNAADVADSAVMIGKEHVHDATKETKRTIRPPKGDVEDTTDDIRKHGER